MLNLWCMHHLLVSYYTLRTIFPPPTQTKRLAIAWYLIMAPEDPDECQVAADYYESVLDDDSCFLVLKGLWHQWW